MLDFIKGLFLGPDGKPDEQALISMGGAAVLLGLEVYNVAWLHQPFDMQSFGIAVAGIGVHRAAMGFANAKEAS